MKDSLCFDRCRAMARYLLRVFEVVSEHATSTASYFRVEPAKLKVSHGLDVMALASLSELPKWSIIARSRTLLGQVQRWRGAWQQRESIILGGD
jgi:hypothetical protein